jgi:hypothetical protein
LTAADPFDLERFVTAQAPVFPAVLAELKAGRKRTHWMWFVFPQLRGLGRRSMWPARHVNNLRVVFMIGCVARPCTGKTWDESPVVYAGQVTRR